MSSVTTTPSPTPNLKPKRKQPTVITVCPICKREIRDTPGRYYNMQRHSQTHNAKYTPAPKTT